MIIKKVLILVLFFCCSCSVLKSRDKHEEMVTFVKQQKYDEAAKTVMDKDFYSVGSDLLKYLELGNIYYLKGEYKKSLDYFDQGFNLSKDLYTTSIKGKIIGALVNENYDVYYGLRYELSMLRFFNSLAHYRIYESGRFEDYEEFIKCEEDEEDDACVDGYKLQKISGQVLTDDEKRAHLEAALSMVREWDGFLKEQKQKDLGEPIYKDDLLARVYGAFLHEIEGTVEDRGIALNLYKSALEVLFKNYNIYPTFNIKYKDFQSDFDKLHEISEKDVKRKYVINTKAYRVVEEFLKAEIKRLEKGREKSNVKLVVKEGLITSKQVETVEFDLPIALILARVDGDQGVLDLLPKLLGGSKLKFEMPKVLEPLPAVPYLVKVYDDENKEVVSKDLLVINPLSDIAYQDFKRNEVSIKAKILAASAMKYAGAVASAYSIYKQNEKSTVGLISAVIAFKLSLSSIEESDRVDIRNWGILPGNIFASSFTLKKGDYKIKIFGGEGNKKVIFQDKIKVEDEIKIFDININQK